MFRLIKNNKVFYPLAFSSLFLLQLSGYVMDIEREKEIDAAMNRYINEQPKIREIVIKDEDHISKQIEKLSFTIDKFNILAKRLTKVYAVKSLSQNTNPTIEDLRKAEDKALEIIKKHKGRSMFGKGPIETTFNVSEAEAELRMQYGMADFDTDLGYKKTYLLKLRGY